MTTLSSSPPPKSPRFAPVTLAEAPTPAPTARKWPKTKRDLCQAYQVTQQTLTRWLRPFMPLLVQAGYVKTQRVLTRRQVRIIFECLDEPEGFARTP